jgi:broad specificity phosphatase PhoE
MTKTIELRRHTANDGDVLTEEGVSEAVRIGRTLRGPYDLVVSSGAQRATQAAACFLAGMGARVAGGVVIDEGFRSVAENRWRELYSTTKSGHLDAFIGADHEFVDGEARRFTESLRRVARHVRDGGRALIVGHSPMLEAMVWRATETIIPPLAKGEGVTLELSGDEFSLRG